MVELRQLRTFLAVAEQLSLSAAARSLGQKPEMVLRRVEALEREYGLELVQRRDNELRLTPAGSALATRARQILWLADAALEDVRDFGSGANFAVRVGLTSDIGQGDRNQAVEALRVRLPEPSITLVELRPHDLRQRLVNQEIDLALVATDGIDETGLHGAELRPTPLAIYAGEGHPVTRAQRTRLADISRVRLLLCKPAGTPYSDLKLSRFASAGTEVATVEGRVSGGMAQSLVQLPELDAIALLPAGTPTPVGVKSVLVEDATFPLRILWAAGRPSPAVNCLREALRVGA